MHRKIKGKFCKACWLVALLFFSATFSSQSLADYDSSLIGSWSFDEDDGPLAYDSSGYANDGIIEGADRIIEGISGNALLFDGVDDYIKVPHDDILNANGQITVEAWINGNGAEFSLEKRILPGGIPAGLPKIKVHGDNVYYTFNAGHPDPNIWTAVTNINGSNWITRQHTDNLRNDWQIGFQIVENIVYFVWHTSGEWYGATMGLDGSNFIETKLSSGDHDHI